MYVSYVHASMHILLATLLVLGSLEATPGISSEPAGSVVSPALRGWFPEGSRFATCTFTLVPSHRHQAWISWCQGPVGSLGTELERASVEKGTV